MRRQAQAGHWARERTRGRAAGRCASGRTSRRVAGARADAQQGSGAGAAWALGARPMRTGWASWVLVHPAWFLTWFFDSVFFLSY